MNEILNKTREEFILFTKYRILFFIFTLIYYFDDILTQVSNEWLLRLKFQFDISRK